MGTEHTSGVEPMVYVVQVKGLLDASWSDCLGGMTVVGCGTRGAPETTLIGVLPDQAALYGVLMTLYHNRLPLLSVRSFASR